MTWELTEELSNTIIEHLENGISLVRICQMDGMPSRSTVLRWQRKDTGFDAECARAREAQGEFAAEKLYDINDKVEAGTLDPAAARVISSNLQWTASKLYSKKYGDKQDINLNGRLDLSGLTDEQLASQLKESLAVAGVSIAGSGNGETEE